jgi:hypothetical protein
MLTRTPAFAARTLELQGGPVRVAEQAAAIVSRWRMPIEYPFTRRERPLVVMAGGPAVGARQRLIAIHEGGPRRCRAAPVRVT